MGEIKTIGITGASGFIGLNLSRWLQWAGYSIVELNRDVLENGNDRLQSKIDCCDAVINLAGASINKRWTKQYKKLLISSRVDVTKKLVSAINKSQSVKLLISTSAVGIYPSSGCHDESCTTTSDSFLGKLCVSWEAEARNVRPDIRCVIARFGIVMAKHGGAFDEMIKPYRLGINATLAEPQNYTSWIDIDDHIRAIQFIIENDNLAGVFNLTAPNPFNQMELAHALSGYYKTYMRLNMTPLLLKILMGESSELLTLSSCVKPQRLLSSGFMFKTLTISDFLKKIYPPI